MDSSQSSRRLHLGMPHVSRDTVIPSQLVTAPLATGHDLPAAGDLEPWDEERLCLCGGRFCCCCGRVFHLKNSKHCSGMLVPHYKVRWKSSLQKARQESPAVQNGMN